MLAFALLAVLFHPALRASARQITVVNSCAATVWPAIFTGGGDIPSQPTGWELGAGQSTSFAVSDNWTAARVWARTNCVADPSGTLQCATGDCRGSGLTCGATGAPPATLAELTLTAHGADSYDISLVDGFNVPMGISLSRPDCKAPACAVNINNVCPSALRTALDAGGHNLACNSACAAGLGGTPDGNKACCTGSFTDPGKCKSCGVDYYGVFKDQCPDAYAYAYDESSGTALWTCDNSAAAPADYTITFCPSGSHYVGPTAASTQYDGDHATC